MSQPVVLDVSYHSGKSSQILVSQARRLELFWVCQPPLHLETCVLAAQHGLLVYSSSMSCLLAGNHHAWMAETTLTDLHIYLSTSASGFGSLRP